ncbi:MAG: alpha/beta fold hydrolase [Deltaproteobacteria bacterium]|nr:alpha/beta fold hydrolase [Deltaproteobacteria bacterium]
MRNIIKSYWNKLKNNFRDAGIYLHFTTRGNTVEKITDFTKKDLKLVLLIHGFATTRRSVSILEKRLRMDGFDVFSINLGGFLGRLNSKGIDELAEIVKNKIDSLDKRYHIGKMAIIGHSKGGLIGRYYVSMLGGDKYVHTLITLGTPHRGLRLAFFATLTVIGLISKSVWQMKPNSRFMQMLQKNPIPPNVYTVSIFSRDDEVVPSRRSRLEMEPTAKHIKNIELGGYTHTDYLIKRGVYEVIRQELG